MREGQDARQGQSEREGQNEIEGQSEQVRRLYIDAQNASLFAERVTFLKICKIF